MDMTVTADNSSIVLLFLIGLVIYLFRQKRPALPARAHNRYSREGTVKHVDFKRSVDSERNY